MIPVLLVALFVLLIPAPSVLAGEDRFNVVVVLVDDMGWMDLSCQGSAYYETPNIDQLAKEGVRFTNGYAACHVCSPTRAAYMTGRHPARIGITDWIRARWNRGGKEATEADRPPDYPAKSNRKLITPNNPYWLDLSERTLAEELRDAGYVTGHTTAASGARRRRCVKAITSSSTGSSPAKASCTTSRPTPANSTTSSKISYLKRRSSKPNSCDGCTGSARNDRSRIRSKHGAAGGAYADACA